MGEEGGAQEKTAQERNDAHGMWLGHIKMTKHFLKTLTEVMGGLNLDNAVSIRRWGRRGSGGGS